jgi:hypothetical protein
MMLIGTVFFQQLETRHRPSLASDIHLGPADAKNEQGLGQATWVLIKGPSLRIFGS